MRSSQFISELFRPVSIHWTLGRPIPIISIKYNEILKVQITLKLSLLIWQLTTCQSTFRISINHIIQHLKNDLKSIYSYTLVNRHLCRIITPRFLKEEGILVIFFDTYLSL